MKPKILLGIVIACFVLSNFFSFVRSENQPMWATYYNEGVTEAYQGNTDKAIELFRKSIVLNAQNSAAFNNLAALLVQKKNWNEAVQHYETAVALDPGNNTALGNLGLVYLNLGRNDKALEISRTLQSRGVVNKKLEEKLQGKKVVVPEPKFIPMEKAAVDEVSSVDYGTFSNVSNETNVAESFQSNQESEEEFIPKEVEPGNDQDNEENSPWLGLGLVLLICIGVVLSLALYFLPTIIAYIHKHHNKAAILIINLFLGWSILGWVAALVMVVWNKEQSNVVTINQKFSEKLDIDNEQIEIPVESE